MYWCRVAAVLELIATLVRVLGKVSEELKSLFAVKRR